MTGSSIRQALVSGAGPPESAQWFCQWTSESAQDERVGRLHLKDTMYAVFGCGNREYGRAWQMQIIPARHPLQSGPSFLE